ncbi:pentapeptide repeat-containing protein [Paracoccus ravus]|uniref:pentapeptide repeat-containing protein n=1 Tax=Paracoccus ravus TaxID=2447760 RepID=UPI00106E3DCF|nr:pentapeptide repeat-containing protein [Paracoccus ravus]
MPEFSRADIMTRIASSGPLRMAGADLAGLDLSGLWLAGADLSYADLSGCDLSDTELSGASLWSARAAGTRFYRCNLTGASLGLAILAGADLRAAILEDADFTGADMTGADMTGSRMRGAWLDTLQRALAIGAPPLRYPEAVRAPIRIRCDEALLEPLELRCGDRVELQFRRPANSMRIEHRDVDTREVLEGPLTQGRETDQRVLRFRAMKPGKVHLRITHGDGEPPLELEVTVQT